MYDPSAYSKDHQTDGTLKMPYRLGRKIQRRFILCTLIFIAFLFSLYPQWVPAPLGFIGQLLWQPVDLLLTWWQGMPAGEDVLESLLTIFQTFAQKIENINL